MFARQGGGGGEEDLLVECLGESWIIFLFDSDFVDLKKEREPDPVS